MHTGVYYGVFREYNFYDIFGGGAGIRLRKKEDTKVKGRGDGGQGDFLNVGNGGGAKKKFISRIVHYLIMHFACTQ